MGTSTLDVPARSGHHGYMDAEPVERVPLLVEQHALSMGADSVGLPGCVTAEGVIDKFVELLDRVRPEGGGPRSSDISALAAATGFSSRAVANLVDASRVPA